ncbi:MAG: hypothetical protein MJA83_11535 [Gammaproteobacteria bacterium]|nr:hypothetical protein [Gammaproteobacteria bacterium]
MKRLCLILLLTGFSFSANAALVSATGTIEGYEVYTLTCDGCSNASGVMWIRLTGVNSLGSCPTHNQEGLIFTIDPEDLFLKAALLDAYTHNRQIKIRVRDDVLIANLCKLLYFKIV